MKVIDIIKNKKKPTLSFEFFPPKNEEQEKNLFRVMSELKKYAPDYVSVTYGALGTTIGRTFFWAKKIKDEFSIEPVAHLTCVAASRDEIKKRLAELKGMGVGNLLALRGDLPQDPIHGKVSAGEFAHAAQLVALIKNTVPEICVGVAGYPEKHPEAENIDADIRHLKEKVDAGADYIVTQLFFDNRHYYAFVDKCRKQGVNVPIIPGIMPITSLKQLKKITGLCGAEIPKELLAKLEAHSDNAAATEELGVIQAVSQCQDLLKSGVTGIHFFVMNQSGPIAKITARLPQLQGS